MIAISIVIGLIILHFIGDFILQSDYVAKNKSKDFTVLLHHVILYGAPFVWLGLNFYLVTITLHFMIDFVTSRATSYMYPRNIHWFFVIIGFDQMLHMISLILTYKYLVG